MDFISICPTEIVLCISKFLNYKEIYDFLYCSSIFAKTYSNAIKTIFTFGDCRILPWQLRFRDNFPFLYEKYDQIHLCLEEEKELGLLLGLWEMKKNSPKERILIISEDVEKWMSISKKCKIHLQCVTELPTENYPPIFKKNSYKSISKRCRTHFLTDGVENAWDEYQEKVQYEREKEHEKMFGNKKYDSDDEMFFGTPIISVKKNVPKLNLEELIKKSDKNYNFIQDLDKIDEKEVFVEEDLSDKQESSVKEKDLSKLELEPESNYIRDINKLSEASSAYCNNLRFMGSCSESSDFNEILKKEMEGELKEYPILVIDYKNFLYTKNNIAYHRTPRYHVLVRDFESPSIDMGLDVYKVIDFTERYLTSHWVVTKPKSKSKIRSIYEIVTYPIVRAMELVEFFGDTKKCIIVVEEHTFNFCNVFAGELSESSEVKTEEDNGSVFGGDKLYKLYLNKPASRVPSDKSVIKKFLENKIYPYSQNGDINFNKLRECDTFIFVDRCATYIIGELFMTRNKILTFYHLSESMEDLCARRIGPGTSYNMGNYVTFLMLLEFLGLDILTVQDDDVVFILGYITIENWLASKKLSWNTDHKVLSKEEFLQENLTKNEFSESFNFAELKVEDAEKLNKYFKYIPNYQQNASKTGLAGSNCFSNDYGCA
jgi:hypothetical protein